MTYPITPDPQIHQAPKSALNQQRMFLTAGQLQRWEQTLPFAMTVDLINVILAAFGVPQPDIKQFDQWLAAANSGLQQMFGSANNSSRWLSALINGVVQQSGATIFDLIKWLQNFATEASDANQQLINFFQTGNWTDLSNFFSDLLSALTGIPPVARDNADGTAAITASITNNNDGTATPTAFFGIADLFDGTASALPTASLTDNHDGTAVPATALTFNSDGTASLLSQFGLSPQQSLFDNGDGTGTSVAHSLNNLLSQWGIHTNLVNALFGGQNIGESLLNDILPNITAGSGNGQSWDLQSIADQIHQASVGGSGTGTPINGVYGNMTSIPMENIVISDVTATTVTHDATGTVYTQTPNSWDALLSGSAITVGASADLLIATVAVFHDIGAVIDVVKAWIHGTNTFLNLLGSIESPVLDGYLFVFGLAKPPSGAITVDAQIELSSLGNKIYIAGLETSSYAGVVNVGTAQTASGNNSNPTQTGVTSATNHMIVQSFAGFGLNTSVGMTGYTQTQRLNSNNIPGSPNYDLGLLLGDAAGSGAGTTFSAAFFNVNSNASWAGVALDLSPAMSTRIGSGMLVTNTSSATYTSTGGSAQAIPSGYYNATPTYITSDLTWNSTTQQVTVSLAGSYKVEFSILESATVTVNSIRCVLYQNGNPIKHGSSTYVGTTSANAYIAHGAFQIYCSPNDTLSAGYYCTASITGLFTGEATGTFAHFSVELLNRSQNG